MQTIIAIGSCTFTDTIVDRDDRPESETWAPAPGSGSYLKVFKKC
jgi:hypothetical protein